MDFAVLATTFALIFAVELPDKTFIATIVLATRYPHFPVWIGVSTAFLVQTVVAILAGGLVTLAPHRVVIGISAVLFAIGAIVLWRNSDTTEEEALDTDDEVKLSGHRVVAATGFRAALACFLVLFAAEWGDLSQILTVTLAASNHDRDPHGVAVGIGAFLALATVTALGVVVGRTLTRFVSLSLIRRVGASICAVLAVVAAAEASGAL
jgi:putative Ca2+/H+ antiporter (TMEM165/GDT1 family)